jgi:hypothetical protein
MVNTICVTSDGIAAAAEPGAMRSLNSLFAPARREALSMVMFADLPLSPTLMATVDVPTLPVVEPPPHPAVIASKEIIESSNITLLMTNLCFSLGCFHDLNVRGISH